MKGRHDINLMVVSVMVVYIHTFLRIVRVWTSMTALVKDNMQ